MASVRYIVNDVDEAVAFYTGLLGFVLRQQFGPAMAILEHDGMMLWVAGPSASASKPMPDGRKPVPGGWNRLVLEVTDLASRVEALKRAGATFRNAVVDGPVGRQILCEDPSGNPIELFEPARRA